MAIGDPITRTSHRSSQGGIFASRFTKGQCSSPGDHGGGSAGIAAAEQIVQIVAVACEDPADSGRPVSHWTPREVAEEVRKRGIVETISPRSVGRFLKSGGFAAPSGRVLAQRQAG